MNKLPNWCDTLLQGIAFWSGYKMQLFPYYLLNEGAIISEAMHLIYSKLPENQILDCEIMYKKLGSNNNNQKRVDLVIREKGSKKIDTIIEAKRAQAQNNLIQKDFQKLGEFKKSNPDTTCLLLLVSLKGRPKPYTDKNGYALRKEICINKDYIIKVRRVCRAIPSIKNIKKTTKRAYYACLIEVLLKES